MGRKPIPNVLKLVSDRKSKRNPVTVDDTAPGRGKYDPPYELNDNQKKIWRETIDAAPAGLLRTLDLRQLAIFVIACDLHEQSYKETMKTGLIVKTPGKKKTVTNKAGVTTTIETGGAIIQSPALGVLNKQALIILKVGSELGFSPTSRARITLGSAEKETNRFSKNTAATRA